MRSHINDDSGFSEFEFLGLVAAGLLIAGLLAHFVFDQSIQVERLNALVHRDGVRLALESRLTDLEVLKKSAQSLDKDSESAVLRACLLGDGGNAPCARKNACCIARKPYPMPILELGDSESVIAGTGEAPSCLDDHGKVSSDHETCFASALVDVEAICAEGAEKCGKALAVIVRYRIQFLPEFLKNEPALATLERTISLLLDADGASPKSTRQ